MINKVKQKHVVRSNYIRLYSCSKLRSELKPESFRDLCQFFQPSADTWTCKGQRPLTFYYNLSPRYVSFAVETAFLNN